MTKQPWLARFLFGIGVVLLESEQQPGLLGRAAVPLPHHPGLARAACRCATPWSVLAPQEAPFNPSFVSLLAESECNLKQKSLCPRAWPACILPLA